MHTLYISECLWGVALGRVREGKSQYAHYKKFDQHWVDREMDRYIYLSIHLSIYLSIYPSIYLSIYLFYTTIEKF